MAGKTAPSHRTTDIRTGPLRNRALKPINRCISQRRWFGLVLFPPFAGRECRPGQITTLSVKIDDHDEGLVIGEDAGQFKLLAERVVVGGIARKAPRPDNPVAVRTDGMLVFTANFEEPFSRAMQRRPAGFSMISRIDSDRNGSDRPPWPRTWPCPPA